MNLPQLKVAEYLLKEEAVFLRPNDPFTWASGIKSPIYCDNRQLISNPEARKFITQCFCDLIIKYFPETNLVAGTSTAGIPWAAWVANELNLPMVYVRSSPKEHGRENLVEGKLKANSKVVVIEDLISTGGSSYKVVEALQKENMDVQGLLAIFSYEFRRANQMFESANLPVHTLTSFQNLLKTAQKLNFLEESDTNKVEKWREQFL